MPRCPGSSMYLLIGRTEDYAWSLTSANHDVRDVFVEVLCEPDGSSPTRESGHYEFDGECIPFEEFDAGTLGDVPIRYPISVHGPVIGTATSEGAPVALDQQAIHVRARRPEPRRAQGHDRGRRRHPGVVLRGRRQVRVHVQLGLRQPGRHRLLRLRAASRCAPRASTGGCRRSGTGEYEWQGFLEQDEHPHADGHPTGRLLNWNNQSAPGFMHGDNNQYGSVHRVESFDQWPEQVDLAGVVGRDEPIGDRGRALDGVAGDQRGARRR